MGKKEKDAKSNSKSKSKQAPILVRICLLGERMAGKSALATRFVQGAFAEGYQPTMKTTKKKEIRLDGVLYEVEITDTPSFGILTKLQAVERDCYLTNDGFILVYSVSDKVSFDIAMEARRRILEVRRECPMALIGTKVDSLNRQSRQVDEQLGFEFASQEPLMFFRETTATRSVCNHIFVDLINMIIKSPDFEAFVVEKGPADLRHGKKQTAKTPKTHPALQPQTPATRIPVNVGPSWEPGLSRDPHILNQRRVDSEDNVHRSGAAWATSGILPGSNIPRARSTPTMLEHDRSSLNSGDSPGKVSQNRQSASSGNLATPFGVTPFQAAMDEVLSEKVLELAEEEGGVNSGGNGGNLHLGVERSPNQIKQMWDGRVWEVNERGEKICRDPSPTPQTPGAQTSAPPPPGGISTGRPMPSPTPEQYPAPPALPPRSYPKLNATTPPVRPNSQQSNNDNTRQFTLPGPPTSPPPQTLSKITEFSSAPALADPPPVPARPKRASVGGEPPRSVGRHMSTEHVNVPAGFNSQSENGLVPPPRPPMLARPNRPPPVPIIEHSSSTDETKAPSEAGGAQSESEISSTESQGDVLDGEEFVYDMLVVDNDAAKEAAARAKIGMPKSGVAIEDLPFFHPADNALSRNERRAAIERVLASQPNGSWLLRSSHNQYVVSLSYNKTVRHLMILERKNAYFFSEDSVFPTIPQLLAHYHENLLNPHLLPICLGNRVNRT